MLEQSANEENRSPALGSEIKPRIPWRVLEAAPLENYRLSVRFVDGTSGTVDLSKLIHSSRAGVFAQLADQNLFRRVFVDHGAVTWPGELDLAPDAMYTEITRSGEWILS